MMKLSSPYIIWNKSWWSRTCEELGFITSRPYITFASLFLCYDALMLLVHDQMMSDKFLRLLLLSSLFSSLLYYYYYYSLLFSSLLLLLYYSILVWSCSTLLLLKYNS
jgi:hypothetical protein